MFTGDQEACIRIGILVERTFPGMEWSTLEELRTLLNNAMGTNIEKGQPLRSVLANIEARLYFEAYDRAKDDG